MASGLEMPSQKQLNLIELAMCVRLPIIVISITKAKIIDTTAVITSNSVEYLPVELFTMSLIFDSMILLLGKIDVLLKLASNVLLK